MLHATTEANHVLKQKAGVAQKQKAEVEKVVKAEIDKVAEAQKEVVESEFHYSITYGGILFVTFNTRKSEEMNAELLSGSELRPRTEWVEVRTAADSGTGSCMAQVLWLNQS